MMKITTLILAVGLLTACSVSRPSSSYSIPTTQQDLISESLFNSNERTISEEDIQRLLDGTIKFPDSARIAIYNFGTTSLSSYYSYRQDEELLKLQQTYIETLTSAISNSDGVSRVVLMPSFMTSSNPTLTNLRESAVRLQADLLVIFSIKSDIYYKYKAFKKDQAKAFATVESVILDIRTGVAPYTNIVTQEQLIQKESTDLDIVETQKRAEAEAVVAALTESATELVNFLNEKRR